MKKKMSVLLVLLMVFSIAGTCFAGELSFKMKHVDSNSWSPIGNARKDESGTYGELKITKIYNDKQEESSTYFYVKAKATPTGSPDTARKGTWCTLSIPSNYQAAGDLVPLYCQGNISFLDCYITGYWNVH